MNNRGGSDADRMEQGLGVGGLLRLGQWDGWADQHAGKEVRASARAQEEVAAGRGKKQQKLGKTGGEVSMGA